MKCPNKLTIITRKIRISRRFYLLNNRFYKMFLLIEQSRCDRCSNILFIFIFTPLRHASPLSSPYCRLSRRQSQRRLDLSNFRHARNTRQWKKRIGKLCSRGWPDVMFDQDETGGVQRSAAWSSRQWTMKTTTRANQVEIPGRIYVERARPRSPDALSR